MDFEKLEHRSVIKFLTLEGKQPTEIHDRMVAVYCENAPSLSTVKKWAAEFKRGRQSLEDDPRSGRPTSSTSTETATAVEQIVLNDRRVKAADIALALGISKASVLTIIHEHLGMSKVCARWVPKMLSTLQKSDRVETSRQNLALYNENSEDFLRRLVTGDETWLHHYDPESKQESMQWRHRDSPPPVKYRSVPSAKKVMATIFWDVKGLLLIDYLPHGTTITGDYYAGLLRNLRDSIKQNRRGKLSAGVLLLHDNAPVHRARISQAAFQQCGFEELPHPPYSPDLAPSDYYLFGHLKSHLRGKRFKDDKEVQDATEAWFSEKNELFFKTGLECLHTRWTKCIDLGGDYVEKK